MTVLQRATGPALVSWPVLLLVVIWSTVLSLLGSGSTASGNLLVRAGIACLGGMAACAVVLLCWQLFLGSDKPRTALALVVIALAGLVRGAVVQVGFVSLGFAGGTASDFVLRIVPSIFTISFAFLVGATGVAAVTAYRQSAGLLLAEQRRLVSLIDSSALGIEERQSDALERVQQRLDASLRDLALETAPSAVTSLESLAGDVVRPLSHSLARELPEWDAQVPESAPRVSLLDVMRSPVPSAALRPLLLPAALMVIAVPAAVFVYEPRIGILTVVVGMAVLALVLALGRAWLTRRPPRQPVLAWTAIVLVLAVAAIATSWASRLVDRADASAGAIPSLAYFAVPVFGLLIAVASMVGARMNAITAELESTTARLQWNLARINTQQWEQSGRLSRALHGPVQSTLHAQLLRLRRQLEQGNVSTTELDGLRTDLQRALATALAPSDTPRAVAQVLADVADTWEGLAHVDWQISRDAEEILMRDPLCAQALADLATEAVSNSVRHGKATGVDIAIDLDEEQPASGDGQLIRLRATDDGHVPDSVRSGLGTVLLTRCTYDWSLSREPTMLIARLPCQSLAEERP